MEMSPTKNNQYPLHCRLKASPNASISFALKLPCNGLDNATTIQPLEFFRTAPMPTTLLAVSIATFVFSLSLPGGGAVHLGACVNSEKALNLYQRQVVIDGAIDA
uniref:Uncharacterized protein n=1 Tax=Cannabis sativa TaxID=3483 RepID=A0A803PMQ6_CANSA